MWVLWTALLFTQNVSFTLVSRARNSNSLLHHALAGLGSNGIWFLSQLILVDNFLSILKTGSVWQAVGVGVFYTAFTLGGSIFAHWLAVHKLGVGVKQ